MPTARCASTPPCPVGCCAPVMALNRVVLPVNFMPMMPICTTTSLGMVEVRDCAGKVTHPGRVCPGKHAGNILAKKTDQVVSAWRRS